MNPQESRSLFQHGWRFALVGSINTALDIGLLTLLVLALQPESTLMVLVLNSISFGAGVTFSYIGNRFFAFRDRPPGRGPLVFFLVSLGGLGVNDVAFWLMRGLILTVGLHGILATDAAKIVATGASMLFNFTLYRQVVFTEKPASQN